ncbi:MAG: KamA family radical SAM protein [Bdellovibrionaceae bacterium]|nr:KamA family radical SAM protein [Pseudobdellovibrionaceae bacterium]
MNYNFLFIEPPPGVKLEDWHNWQWQTRNALKKREDFSNYFQLSEEELQAFDNPQFKIQVTPYYARLASLNNPQNPIRKILMPNIREYQSHSQQMLDPLGENQHRPHSRIIHRYTDRLLFLITDYCSVYCRYCTRKHFTGKDQAFINQYDYESALKYISQRKEVREVILSGGDPLTLSNERLVQVVKDISQIDHVDLIRIGTRMPIVSPMRIQEDLLLSLKKYHPIYFMLHFNHPKEITAQSAKALSLLVDHGFPTFNQMVLLNGVNNHPAIVKALSRRLLKLRVKPYYMFQCDPSEGSDHLRTSVENSMEIQRKLWGNLSGLAMPNLSLDIPGGGGKVGIVPNFEVHHQNEKRFYKGWDGKEGVYISPPPQEIIIPNDVFDYQEE